MARRDMSTRKWSSQIDIDAPRSSEDPDWIDISFPLSPEEAYLISKHSEVKRLVRNGKVFFAVPFGLSFSHRRGRNLCNGIY
jgi:hypothetical protein